MDAERTPIQALDSLAAPVGGRGVLPHLRHRRTLEQSPAQYVRRPRVPPASPPRGLPRWQSGALLTSRRDSHNPNDLALVAMLGLLGLRIFEASCRRRMSRVTSDRPSRMRGGIVQRGSTWTYVVREIAPATGKTRPRWVGGFPT